MIEEDLEFLLDLKMQFWVELTDLWCRYMQEAADRHPDYRGPRFLEWIEQVQATLGEPVDIHSPPFH